jgi:predicted nucleotidyltransferase
MDTTSPAFARYAATARARARRQRQALEERQALAWGVARKAATLLKTEFGVQRVVAFGSVTRPASFHARSDIDLAVWGLDERTYLRAVSQLLDLEPGFSVDLVEAEYARPELLKAIQREGTEL